MAEISLRRDAQVTCLQHIHVAGTGDSLDRCDECGHDLRARCHERVMALDAIVVETIVDRLRRIADEVEALSERAKRADLDRLGTLGHVVAELRIVAERVERKFR